MPMLTINTAIIDRLDLSIQEKMCCIVLARLTLDAKDEHISIEDVAALMGCPEKDAGKALEKLKSKGLLLERAKVDAEPRKSKVLKKAKEKEKHSFEDFEKPLEPPKSKEKKMTMQQKIDELRTFIVEPVTDGTLRILLNMAHGDVETIRKHYKMASKKKGFDALESLIQVLQGGEEKGISEQSDKQLDPEARQALTQINQKRIAELYSKNKKVPPK